ncbi:MAG: ABC transporter substrate-binding protein [Chitinophagaceae bacterium BSSC1]|nr:MAG: ABC transporter substrate-binding protein [Chitinophagaceae bacterium BSSC1]
MAKVTLKGITWGHSRGFTPLLAMSQRYTELYPEVTIQWDIRSLQAFADYPIEKLTESYDLLIIDHPWVGCAAATNCVLPLDQYLDASYLENQLENSVGNSHLSYHYQGHQWALAIDAATPAASYRPDLFAKAHQTIPNNWEALLDLAKAGKVAIPAIPIDCLMNFYSFCILHGKYPFTNQSILIDNEIGCKALETMKELYSLLDPRFFQCNPIAVAELMSSTNDYWYCPFAYGYSNYARDGYAQYLLRYTGTVSVLGHQLRTTIGGTGLSVSAHSKYPELALAFTQMAVSEAWQSGIYVQHGGQPGHLAAWKNDIANTLTNDYFKQVLPLMERGYTRPRYNGYLYFQDHAGAPVQAFLMGKISALDALEQMNELYQTSLTMDHSIALV